MKKILKNVIARKSKIFVAIQKKLCLTGLLRRLGLFGSTQKRGSALSYGLGFAVALPKIRPLAVTGILFLALSTFASEKVQVTLSRVYDGDTIEIINEKNQKEVIRFLGIDCYESKPNQRSYRQAYENKKEIYEVVAEGTKSTLALVQLFKDNPDKNLYLIRHGKDGYNRTLGVLYLGKININKYMLDSGNALEYTHIKY